VTDDDDDDEEEEFMMTKNSVAISQQVNYNDRWTTVA
jgi:hypothetical protein